MTLVVSIGNNGIEETEGVNGVKAITLNETGNLIEAEITGGGSGWQAPSDWIDISTANDNEINLLVSDKCVGYAFSVTTQSGTYSIDWGDGNIETSRVSGTIYQHQYLTDGTPCSEGYGTFKIRIYGASSNITRFKVERHTYQSRPQTYGYLWVVFGTRYITTYASTFFPSNGSCYTLRACTISSFQNCTNTADMFNRCYGLQSVTFPASWGNVSNASFMFSYCYGLQSVTLPASWGNVSNINYMFSYCYCLQSIVLPPSWANMYNASGTFVQCTSLQSIVLPSSWGILNDISYLFMSCTNLDNVVLPDSYGNMGNISAVFYQCSRLRNALNIQYMGSLSRDANASIFLADCELITSVVTDSRLSAFGAPSYNNTYLNKLSSLRLTNPNSTFTGSSPQIDVQYCSMDATALNTLFGDLPTLSGKTIRITGNPGAGSCNTSIATAKGWTVTQ